MQKRKKKFRRAWYVCSFCILFQFFWGDTSCLHSLGSFGSLGRDPRSPIHGTMTTPWRHSSAGRSLLVHMGAPEKWMAPETHTGLEKLFELLTWNVSLTQIKTGHLAKNWHDSSAEFWNWTEAHLVGKPKFDMAVLGLAACHFRKWLKSQVHRVDQTLLPAQVDSFVGCSFHCALHPPAELKLKLEVNTASLEQEL